MNFKHEILCIGSNYVRKICDLPVRYYSERVAIRNRKLCFN
jgi:hypothetical protein